MLIGSVLVGCGGNNSQQTNQNNTENQFTESITYTSLNENEPHQFDDELVKDNDTFKLKNVTYETVSSKPITEEQTLEIKDLYEQKADAEQEHTFTHSAGKTVQGKLSNISYNDTIITNRTTTLEATTNSGYVISEPTPDSTKTVQYFDNPSGQTVTKTLPLQNFKMTTGYNWVSDVVIPMQVQVYDASFYLLNGKYVPYNNDKPALTGYESDILTVLNLPKESYKITDFTWNGEAYAQDGIQYRNASATGQRYVAEYTSYYNDTVTLPDAPGYNAVLTYDVETGQTEYTIKATAEYEKQNTGLTLTQIIVISVVGVFLLILLIVAILFVIAKKKKQKDKGVH